ncbi:MAG: hypothetical protein ABJF50_03455 [Paracoccaceae bacterium]
MSSSFLVVIPKVPNADIPKTAPDVKALLSKMAGTDEARIKNYGKVQFIDCGEAFEFVACPNCETQLSVEQWHTLMYQDWHSEDGFHLHEHAMPCCAVVHTLDALRYVAPQGFSKWLISARAHNRGPLTGPELKQLEDVAGMRLRAIIQQY